MDNYYKMILAEHTTLETPRLLLRPHGLQDTLGVFDMSSDPRALEYLVWGGLSTMEEAEDVITKYYPTRDAIFAIERKETGDYIGSLEVRMMAEHSKVEFGYVSRQKFWGNGYMSEALTAVVDFCFTSLQVNRVESNHFIQNIGSGKVMKKAGMLYEGEAKDWIKVKGKFQSFAFYGLTKAQWLANK